MGPLEKRINKFLSTKPDIEIVDIKYQDGSTSEGSWYSAMIIYKS